MTNEKITGDQRIVKAALGTILFMILLFSFIFDPSTYQLIDCYFNNVTGLPCPSCGLTRSFNAMAHLQIAEAFGLNWMGPILFTGILLIAVLFLIESVSGNQLQFTSKLLSLKVLIYILLGLWLVTWLVRLIVVGG